MTMEKPKRPLSSFNLFYRYKRSLFLQVQGENLSKETAQNIIACPAGLEDELLLLPQSTSQSQQLKIEPSPETNELRRSKIRAALQGKILPSSSDSKKKRRHRKTANGLAIGFVELSRLMSECWTGADPYARQVFDELSLEGRQIYRCALEEYNRIDSEVEEHDGDGGGGSSSSSSGKSKRGFAPAAVSSRSRSRANSDVTDSRQLLFSPPRPSFQVENQQYLPLSVPVLRPRKMYHQQQYQQQQQRVVSSGGAHVPPHLVSAHHHFQETTTSAAGAGGRRRKDGGVKGEHARRDSLHGYAGAGNPMFQEDVVDLNLNDEEIGTFFEDHY